MTSDDDPALEESEPMSNLKRYTLIALITAITVALSALVEGAL